MNNLISIPAGMGVFDKLMWCYVMLYYMRKVIYSIPFETVILAICVGFFAAYRVFLCSVHSCYLNNAYTFSCNIAQIGLQHVAVRAMHELFWQNSFLVTSHELFHHQTSSSHAVLWDEYFTECIFPVMLWYSSVTDIHSQNSWIHW